MNINKWKILIWVNIVYSSKSRVFQDVVTYYDLNFFGINHMCDNVK